jgi:hypothetical protein
MQTQDLTFTRVRPDTSARPADILEDSRRRAFRWPPKFWDRRKDDDDDDPPPCPAASRLPRPIPILDGAEVAPAI